LFKLRENFFKEAGNSENCEERETKIEHLIFVIGYVVYQFPRDMHPNIAHFEYQTGARFFE
jgi:hypothetical protein